MSLPLRTALTLAVTSSVLFASEASAQNKRPMTFEDFSAVRVVGAPQISPDGKTILYTVRTTDVAANSRSSATYSISSSGGSPQLFPNNSTVAGGAVWSPDGSKVAYISNNQLWVVDASGNNPRQLTDLHGGAGGIVWSHAGDKIAFVSSVYPECNDNACNVAKAREKADNPVKAYVTDQLMVRHWNKYDDGTRSHLFVVGVDGSGLIDLTQGATFHVPPAPFGGSEGYTFSPDGSEVSYTAKDMGREEAWSTNSDVYVIPVTGGEATNITAANKGGDNNAVYSPDGRYILYASQARPGFESDQQRLMIYDRTAKTATQLVKSWDRDAYAYFFAPDGNTIYIQTVDASLYKLYALSKSGDGWAETPTLVVGADRNSSGFALSADGSTLAWLSDAVEAPGEIFAASVNGATVSDIRQVTRENENLLSQLQLNPAEEFWFKGATRDSVQGFVIKPPQYEPGKKFPVLLIIHGGPQVPFLNSWHPRWNFSLFAAGGYGIVFINPAGSPGYGQKFVDQVTHDWGGATYKDLMLGLDAALSNHSEWMDSTKLGAAGGSYGGYMVNWINGQTNRFKALFNHAGVFNLENMYGATEEVWFTEWEFDGPYWDKNAMETQYRKWSPHLYAGNMRTPTMVVHGELDYRVPLVEGLSAFTALQRQNVPSRLIIFPDEDHWIHKPQNQRLWYNEFHSWFAQYLR